MTRDIAQGKWFVVYVLGISSFFASLSQNIYTPIIPIIRDSFHVRISWVNFTVSSFIFIIAVIQILLGTVIDHKDKKRLLLVSLVLIGVSAAICAYTDSFALFLLFRMVQAVGAGIIPLVVISIVAQQFEGEARAHAMGTYQILLTLAPAVSPILGGFIGEYFGYEGTFLFLLMIAVVLLIFIVYFLPGEKQTETVKKQRKGFFETYKAVLSHYTGVSIIMVSFMVFFTYFAILVYLPILLHDHYRLTLKLIGLLYLPLSVSMIAGSILFKRLQANRSLNRLLMPLLITMPLLIILFGVFHTQSLIGLSMILFGYGIMVGFSAPLFSTLISNEYIEHRGTALGLFNFVRYSGMALGGMAPALYHILSGPVLFVLLGIVLLFISVLPYQSFQGKNVS
ncbi:MFS transporter [Cytobacillus sp.]|uniref:MFS transporter n=1 Tax=Cytobacillus sp. TaxID=2675269 RepID=UPI0028BDA30F|nr:MFS transporter [Cytobacillus sp.]